MRALAAPATQLAVVIPAPSEGVPCRKQDSCVLLATCEGDHADTAGTIWRNEISEEYSSRRSVREPGRCVELVH